MGYRRCQLFKNYLSRLVKKLSTFPETSVILNQPTCLIVRGDYVNFSYSESIKSYRNNKCIPEIQKRSLKLNDCFKISR
jgi:hypothetical protein